MRTPRPAEVLAPRVDDKIAADSAPTVETPKAFGLRTPRPAEVLAPRVDDRIAAEVEPQQPAPPSQVQSRGQHYQEALDQLIDATEHDARYLETIRHLERSDETLRQPIEPESAEPRSIDPVPDKHAGQRDAALSRAQPAEELPAVAPGREHQGELEDLIDAIKRDSGYLEFAKDAQGPRGDDNRSEPQAEHIPTPMVVPYAHAAPKTPEAEAPRSAKADAVELLVAGASPKLDELPTAEPENADETVSTHPPEFVTGAAADTRAEEPIARAAAMPVADLEAVQLADARAATLDQANEPASPDSETAATQSETPAGPEVPALQDQQPPAAEARPADAEQTQSFTTPSVDDGTIAPQPEERESKSRKPPGEIAAPAADWLADLSSLKTDDVTAQAGDASLERIEWPALSKTADDDVPPQKPDTATAHFELAEPDKAPSGVAEEAPALAKKAEGAEDFASKADRLSDLLVKLEQAMQAKAAPPSTPSVAPDAAVVAPSTAPAGAVEHIAPQTPASVPAAGTEPEIAGPERPVEQAQEADQPDKGPAPLAEVPAADRGATPRMHRPSSRDLHRTNGHARTPVPRARLQRLMSSPKAN